MADSRPDGGPTPASAPREPGPAVRPRAPPGSRPRRRRTSGRGPGAPRRPRQRTAAGRRCPPRPRFTGRAAILVLVLALLMVSYASSMRAYLDQRRHIADAAAPASPTSQVADRPRCSARRSAGRTRRTSRTQARQRFGWVLPGEIGFQVLDEDGKPLDPTDTLPKPRADHRGQPAAVVAVGLGQRRGGRQDAGRADRAAARGEDRRPQGPGGGQGRGLTWSTPLTQAVIGAQLGRPPRAIHAIGHRCPCGNPDVVATEPRLEDGTPFPTTFYLTCPRAASLIGTLEASGLMKEMSDRLESDPDLAAAYQRRPRGLPRRPRVDRPGPGDRRRLRRRHAHPGEVPARAGRPVAGPGPRASTRSATRCVDLLGAFWAAGPCVARRAPSA